MSDGPPGPNGGQPADDEYRSFEIAPDEKRYETVIRGVATVTGKDPLEMTPLARAIDPDVLEAAFATGSETPRNAFTFVYQHCEVVVTQSRVLVQHVDSDG